MESKGRGVEGEPSVRGVSGYYKQDLINHQGQPWSRRYIDGQANDKI